MPQLKERLDELTGILITVATEIAELQSKIQPLKQKLSTAIEEKDRLKKIEHSQLTELNRKYDNYKMVVQDIQRYAHVSKNEYML